MPCRPDDCADAVRRTLLAMAAMTPALAMADAVESTPAAAALPPDLAAAVEAYDRATLSNDTTALAELVADDYVLVNSDTTLQNKQQYLDDFNLPGFRIDPYVIEQPLRKVWGNVALTGGLLHLGWTQNGERHSRLLRVAHVWTRHDGRWRMTYTQLTRVPQ